MPAWSSAAWPAQPGAAEKSNRDALAGMAPVRAALPAGRGHGVHGRLRHAERAGVRPGLGRRPLVGYGAFDRAAFRRPRPTPPSARCGMRWTRPGCPASYGSSPPTNRPHVTLLAAGHIAADVDDELTRLRPRFPLPVTVGAPLVFGGGGKLTLARLIVAVGRAAGPAARRRRHVPAAHAAGPFAHTCRDIGRRTSRSGGGSLRRRWLGARRGRRAVGGHRRAGGRLAPMGRRPTRSSGC